MITDLGSAIAVGLAAAAVLIASGAAAGALARLGLAAGALAGAMIAAEPYRMQRLTAFLHPGDKIGAAGYQLYEAKLALGTGGLFGVGLGQSVTKLSYLPEAHTDMIVADRRRGARPDRRARAARRVRPPRLVRLQRRAARQGSVRQAARGRR